MLRRTLFSVILLLGLFAALPLYAQGAPEQIDVALFQLSDGVGRNVTLNDLSNWRWSQDLYPDVSLGCPQPDRAYAQLVTQGYRFLFTYSGVIYDYRVSADESIAFLCSRVNEAELAEATPTPVGPEAVDSSVACSSPEPGVIYLPQRLTATIQAQVVSGPPIILRSEPTETGAVLGEIPGAAIVRIVAGPVCAEGLLWWQVDYDGLNGWTVEGRDGAYWLEMLPAAVLPANLPVLSVENASQMAELSRSEANVTGALALAPDDSRLAVLGGPGSNGLWLYDLSALDTLPSLLRGTTQLTSIDYSSDGLSMLLGDNTGAIRIWTTDTQSSLLERWFDVSHEGLTSAVAYSPDDANVASAGDIASTTATEQRENAILLWDIEAVSQTAALAGHTALVNALAFSPDGSILASASGTDEAEDHSVRLWNPADASQIAVLEGHTAPVQALAFSPDGSQLASLSRSGVVIIWDLETQEQAQSLTSTGLAGYALAFNPDGTLLAVGGGDGSDFAIRLWDVASGAELSLLSGHTARVSGLAFNQAGTLLISVSEDRTLRFWGVN